MPTTAEKLESLLRWIHERPQMYATMAGELDLILDYLHMVWADLKDREVEYDLILSQCYETAAGLLKHQQRTEPVELGSPTTMIVLDFWNRVDTALDIHVRCDAWRSPIRKQTR